jgi:hypothetical protein
MPLVLCRFDSAGVVAAWTPVDDRIMGGISRSRLRFDPAGHAVFEGAVCLEHGGGFASVRSPAGLTGMHDAIDCAIEVRGAARQYKLSLFTTASLDGSSYQIEFVPEAERWTSLRLPLDRFRARFRGREVAEAPALDPARIQQVGLVIAGRQAGAFALEVRSICLA